MYLTLRSFLKYVEIQTKVASMVPFLLGSLYAIYRYNRFYGINFVIMLISLLAFDMATTSINNYIDYKKSSNKDIHNNTGEILVENHGVKESTAIGIIFILLSIAIIFGIILVMRTTIIVLLIGVIAFVVGIFYTFGPIPISRMPLGEAFSGFFMGFIIIFLSIYIHVYNREILGLIYKNGILSLNMNVKELICIFLISIPVIGGIANIMLANNICDVEEDILNNRYTLPYYLGKKKSLLLFKSLYYIGYVDIVAMVILKIAPSWLLLVLLTFIPVNSGIKTFYANQEKRKTFVVSVKNFIIMNVGTLLVMSGVVLAKYLLK